MKYVTETYLTNFDFWSGARSRADVLTYEQLERLDNILPDAMGWNDSNLPSDTEINDLFWFEENFIAQLLGFDSFEELKLHNAKEAGCAFDADESDSETEDKDDDES